MTTTTTNSSPGADLKRVISNPEHLMAESDREEKKTRVEDGMENLALEEDSEEMDGPNNFPISATMSHDDSRLSSLSSGEGSNSDDDDDEDNDKVDGGGVGVAKAVIGGPPLKNRSNNKIKRQVSHDGSLTNSNSSAENRQSSVTGNWGWFEDVHGHESAFLPGLSVSLSGGGGESLGGENNKGNGKEKRKSGIWKMGSDLMQSALSSIVEPHRQGA